MHRGEYVFTKDAVQAIGVGRLESLHRSAQGYATGGFVGAGAPEPVPAAQSGSAPSSGGAIAPNIKVVNVLDPGEVIEAGLSTTIGEQAFLNFVTKNKQGIQGALG